MKIFISHTGKDADIAEFLSKQFNQLSLRQLECWFCNDRSANGGYDLGDQWYSKIFKELELSEFIFVLVTPLSQNKPWLYFEAGHALGLKKIIIPLILGLKKEDLNSTLKNYQAYQLSNRLDIEALFVKVFKQKNLDFDKEYHKGKITEIVQHFSECNFVNEGEVKNDFVEYLEEFKFDLFQRLSHLQLQQEREVNTFSRDVSITFNFNSAKSKKDRKFDISIDSQTTFQEVTNQIYFLISDYVEPFTYLENWIITNNETDEHYIIREIAQRIPAHLLFSPKNTYNIILTDKPYVATDSKDRIG